MPRPVNDSTPAIAAAKRVLRFAVDHGAPGTQPLDSHVVVCGFPRSGTTLLQLIVESCVVDVDSFIGEVEGRWAAAHANRRRRWMITKRPRDIEEVDGLRQWYATYPGSLVVLIPVRDPRDVLTSQHKGYPPSRGYYCSVTRWREVHRRIRALEDDPDVVVFRYEDLLRAPDEVEARLSARLGWATHTPFARFHEAARPASELPPLDRGALGGTVRPLDAPPPERWRDPEHRERLLEIEARVPELSEALFHWGYEADDRWAVPR